MCQIIFSLKYAHAKWVGVLQKKNKLHIKHITYKLYRFGKKLMLHNVIINMKQSAV